MEPTGPSVTDLIDAYFELEGEELIRKFPRRSTERVVKGTLGKKGYLQVSAGPRGSARTLFVHRVKFYLIHGYLPEGDNTVDHWDRDKINNLGSNLRDATSSEQNLNRVMPKTYQRRR